MRIFFVGGVPKSGTTWVQRSLDLHPSVVCSGEGHFQELIIKPMVEMFGVYNRKIDFVGRLVYNGSPYRQAVTNNAVLDHIRGVVLNLMMAGTSSSTVAVGDKTPSYIYNIRDLNILFPDLLFIAIMRDPRDAAVSRLYHAARSLRTGTLQVGSHIWNEVVLAAANGWIKAFERSIAFSRDYPDRIMFVRYEDMLENHSHVLKSMFAFIGVTASSTQIAEVANASSFFSFSGREAGVEDTTSFYRKGTAGDWRRVLDVAAAKTVVGICAEGMREMGYEI